MKVFVAELLTPQKTLFQGRVESLTARAIDGEVQILADHIQYANILPPGEIQIETEDKTSLCFSHAGGILEVEKEKTSVLVY